MAGALVTTEIYDLDTGLWTPGPDMPKAINYGESVQYSNGFLIVGGFSATDGADLDSVYYFNPDTETFDLMATMSAARNRATAFLVPDSLVSCS